MVSSQEQTLRNIDKSIEGNIYIYIYIINYIYIYVYIMKRGPYILYLIEMFLVVIGTKYEAGRPLFHFTLLFCITF